jgi:hypothetical protein
MSNDFYHSAETRWFLPGFDQWDQFFNWYTLQGQLKLVEEIEDYVQQPKAAPFVKEERQRIDEYLFLPDCDKVGVKQRQGRLEVKALAMGPRPFTLDKVAGRMDQWVKWSFKPSEAIDKSLETDLHQSGPWLKVDKKRYTQKYSFDSESLIAVSPDAWPNAGCNIELTRLHVDSRIDTWMTFGFEAFGPSGQIVALLNEALQYFFTSHGPSPIRIEGRDSLSYPSWLVLLH